MRQLAVSLPAARERECPICGRRRPPYRNRKRSAVTMVLLLLLSILPRFLYAIILNGYQDVCHDCCAKLGVAV